LPSYHPRSPTPNHTIDPAVLQQLKEEQPDIPQLSPLPLARELSRTPEGYHCYNLGNCHNYTFAIQVDGQIEWVEFIKYHMDTTDPMMQGLMSTGEGLYGVPLTARAPVWGKESNSTDLQILHEDFWLKRNVQEALTAMKDPGLTGEVARYQGLLKQGADLYHHKLHVKQALEVHLWNMEQCQHCLFASCFHDCLWPIVCSDNPKLHILPDALCPNSLPTIIPNPEPQ
jgi:hypothetical protein